MRKAPNKHTKGLIYLKSKKRGYTDRMYRYNVIFVSVTVGLSFVLMFMSAFVSQIDLTPIGYIVPSAFGELALHTGFMVWKAKAENMQKFSNKTKKLIKEDEYDSQWNNQG